MTLGRTGLKHPHTGLPIEPLGYRKDGRPILPILGAGPDDEDDDDDEEIDVEDDDEDDEDDDEDDEPAQKGDKSKKSSKKDDEDDDEELGEGGKKALRAVRAELRQAKAQLRELRSGKAGSRKGGEDDEDAAEAAESRARELAKPTIVRAEARAALKEAGAVGDVGRLLRLLDMSKIDVDFDDKGDVEIDGIEDQIDELKDEYPQLFEQVTRRRSAGSIDATDKGGRGRSGSSEKGKAKSATERQVEGLRGSRRSR